MNVIIQSVNFEATDALQQYVNKKMSKLERFHDGILTANVFLKVVKPETVMNKQAEIRASVKGEDFFASKVSNTFEEAVDLAVEALEKQVKKHKEKLTKK